MKQQLLLLFFISSLSTGLLGQITITDASFPAPGDTMVSRFLLAPPGVVVTAPGPNQTWNLDVSGGTIRTNIALPASEGEVFSSFPDTEVLLEVGFGAEGYYNVTSDVFELVGFNGPDPAGLGIELEYALGTPYVERRAIQYGDGNSFTSAYDVALAWEDLPAFITDSIGGSLPLTPDSIRILVETTRDDIVDAWGTMTIPGGTFEVLREKRTEFRDTRIEVRVLPLDWFDVTPLISSQIDQLGESTIYSYFFFNNEEKEPIAVIRQNEEEEVINVEYKFFDIGSFTQETSNHLKPEIAAWPNPAINDVEFRFSGLTPGNYNLKIYNILGIPVWEGDYFINSFKNVKIDLFDFQKGTYLYSLTNEEGKTISTKRLVVLRP